MRDSVEDQGCDGVGVSLFILTHPQISVFQIATTVVLIGLIFDRN